jgi:hypothetical protein
MTTRLPKAIFSFVTESNGSALEVDDMLICPPNPRTDHTTLSRLSSTPEPQAERVFDAQMGGGWTITSRVSGLKRDLQ